MKRHRIGPRQAWVLYLMALGWFQVYVSRDDQRLRESLIRLGLLMLDDRPTPLGNALGLYLARTQRASLKRAGVSLLARYRVRLKERFDLGGAAKALSYRIDTNRKLVPVV